MSFVALKVVYLDDEPDLCEAFKDIFSSDSIQITTFCEPEALIRAYSPSAFDMIFVDYRLPNSSGDSVAKKLNPQCPVYLVTGEMSVNTDFKFTEVLSKPYDIEKIQNILDTANK